ncbi:unnamed protein product [Euphydryas editha]|uniref:Uncharacterized protein n=1 Tax=Euphydryas editha TaxID=104508 RepID=A0AAU9TS41_EUPED|nr:unnamed protein product [Euphydryas editha]
MEDVNALANQLASLPVVDQINKIWRRAANQFQREIKRDTRRRGDSDDREDLNKELGDDVTRKIVRNIIEFGKKSGYLGPIKRALEAIDPK